MCVLNLGCKKHLHRERTWTIPLQPHYGDLGRLEVALPVLYNGEPLVGLLVD